MRQVVSVEIAPFPAKSSFLVALFADILSFD